MSFTHKIVHHNDRDEIWVQNKTDSTLNTKTNDTVTAKAVADAINKVTEYRGINCFETNPAAIAQIHELYLPKTNLFDFQQFRVTVCNQLVTANFHLRTQQEVTFTGLPTDVGCLISTIPTPPTTDGHYYCPMFAESAQEVSAITITNVVGIVVCLTVDYASIVFISTKGTTLSACCCFTELS
jgi:hypothetical protein